MRLSLMLVAGIALLAGPTALSAPVPATAPSNSIISLASRAFSFFPTTSPSSRLFTRKIPIIAIPSLRSIRSLRTVRSFIVTRGLAPAKPLFRRYPNTRKRQLSDAEKQTAMIGRALSAETAKGRLMGRGKKAIASAEKRVRGLVNAAVKARRVVQERAREARRKASKRAGEVVKKAEEAMKRKRGKSGAKKAKREVDSRAEREGTPKGKMVMRLVKKGQTPTEVVAAERSEKGKV